MGTLKLLLPCTQSKVIDEEIQGSFGVKVEVNEVSLEIERLLQVRVFRARKNTRITNIFE